MVSFVFVAMRPAVTPSQSISTVPPSAIKVIAGVFAGMTNADDNL
jgi:hypothetical protein